MSYVCIFLYFIQRISIKEIKSHPWFLKNLPRELTDSAQEIYYRKEDPSCSLQTVDEIMKIVVEARNRQPSSSDIGGFRWGVDESKELAEDEEELEEEDEEEDEYERRVKEAHASGEYRFS